jgi:hypothetical protein
MSVFFIGFLFFGSFLEAATSDSFIIQVKNRSVLVTSPQKETKRFAVIVENHSLTKQLGKFISGERNLKFVSVLPGKSETVELLNTNNESIIFIPISPAFQDVVLKFGKKSYEIPAKN